MRRIIFSALTVAILAFGLTVTPELMAKTTKAASSHKKKSKKKAETAVTNAAAPAGSQ